MALIDKASLLMVPSTYEDGTLYNVLPSGNKAPDETGSHNGYDQTRADFTFSRGSNLAATRVNADGLIEKGRENLLLQSNQFDTTWVTPSGVSLTSGQSGYDGSSNAWLLSKTTASGNIYQNTTSSGILTFSVYAKKNASNWVRLRNSVSGTTFYYDLENGEKGTTGSPIDATITSVGNGWYRLTMTENGTNGRYRIYPAESDGSVSGSSGSIYIQDAQLENGLVASSYIETGATTATAGVLENTPRIDYSSGAGALLLEPLRSNLALTSEYAGGSGWFISSGYSVSHNVAISPEGVQNAFELTIPSVNGNTRAIIAVTPSTEYTFSFYVKRGTATELKYSIFNLTNNSNIIAQTSYYSQTSATEWKRIEVTFTTPAGCTSAGVYIDRDSRANGTAFFYGIQCEQGSYASSYIPTYGSAASRSADDAVSVISDTITDADTFTYYFEYIAPEFQSGGGELLIENASGSSQMRIYVNINSSTPKIRFRTDNPSQNIDRDITIGEKVKGCFKVSNGTAKAFLNGSLEHTFNAATIDFKRLHLRPVSKIETGQMILFNEALSDSECESLTA